MVFLGKRFRLNNSGASGGLDEGDHNCTIRQADRSRLFREPPAARCHVSPRVAEQSGKEVVFVVYPFMECAGMDNEHKINPQRGIKQRAARTIECRKAVSPPPVLCQQAGGQNDQNREIRHSAHRVNQKLLTFKGVCGARDRDGLGGHDPRGTPTNFKNCERLRISESGRGSSWDEYLCVHFAHISQYKRRR